MAKSLLNNKTKIKKTPPKKLSLQLFQLNKSTQFSYQHHFITVINKKKSTRRSIDYMKKHTCIVNHHFSLFVFESTGYRV